MKVATALVFFAPNTNIESSIPPCTTKRADNTRVIGSYIFKRNHYLIISVQFSVANPNSERSV
jgi:hypothetical protein